VSGIHLCAGCLHRLEHRKHATRHGLVVSIVVTNALDLMLGQINAERTVHLEIVVAVRLISRLIGNSRCSACIFGVAELERTLRKNAVAISVDRAPVVDEVVGKARHSTTVLKEWITDGIGDGRGIRLIVENPHLDLKRSWVRIGRRVPWIRGQRPLERMTHRLNTVTDAATLSSTLSDQHGRSWSELDDTTEKTRRVCWIDVHPEIVSLNGLGLGGLVNHRLNGALDRSLLHSALVSLVRALGGTALVTLLSECHFLY